MSKSELLAIRDELVAAGRELRKDIPSHPMRDKCFQAMGNAAKHVDQAIALFDREATT